MLTMIAAPLLAIALSHTSGSSACETTAESAGVFPPPGCVVMYHEGTCYLQCDTFPRLRTCDGD